MFVPFGLYFQLDKLPKYQTVWFDTEQMATLMAVIDCECVMKCFCFNWYVHCRLYRTTDICIVPSLRWNLSGIEPVQWEAVLELRETVLHTAGNLPMFQAQVRFSSGIVAGGNPHQIFVLYKILGWKSPILGNLRAQLKVWVPIISSVENLQGSVGRSQLPTPTFLTHDTAAHLGHSHCLM